MLIVAEGNPKPPTLSDNPNILSLEFRKQLALIFAR